MELFESLNEFSDFPCKQIQSIFLIKNVKENLASAASESIVGVPYWFVRNLHNIINSLQFPILL